MGASSMNYYSQSQKEDNDSSDSNTMVDDMISAIEYASLLESVASPRLSISTRLSSSFFSPIQNCIRPRKWRIYERCLGDMHWITRERVPK